MINKLLTITLLCMFATAGISQTTLTEANNFHVKTIYGEPIYLFPLLDEENQIVVIDFFSTTCGPCQDYADDFQACYEKFGSNESNVYFMGINWGNDNQGVEEFDSVFGLTFPTASGSQGGGNIVYQDYNILSYPTVIVITPDHSIVEQYVWYPDEETITAAVISAGGILVNTDENPINQVDVNIYPNPITSAGKIGFHLLEESEIILKIVNIMGQEVLNMPATVYEHGNNTIEFSVEHLQNGYYFVKLDSNTGTIATSRIAVSH